MPPSAELPRRMRELAYEDSPLPIDEGQTISQPYIVAAMVEALQLDPSRQPKVLEIGTGSGYAAAILGTIAGEVYTIERYENLAARAREALERTGFRNVHVRHGDGTLGWPEHAPFDGIVVAAGAPEVPRTLRGQLAPGGRLVIPVGPTQRMQHLLRITRTADDHFREEDLGAVAFVPLVGDEGWGERGADERPDPTPKSAPRAVAVIALEADWPDAAQIDDYVRHADVGPIGWIAFSRFPTWMWRNREFRALVDWLHERNAGIADPRRRVAVYGLDLYSMYASIHSVLRYLDEVDPTAAKVARTRYGCLTPFQADPTVYGHAALTGRYRECEDDVVAMLTELLEKRMQYARADGERFLDAVQNARLVANAERYYRIMYYGSVASWNLRDQHMFDTLRLVLDTRGPDSKAIVWAHNSHLGDASATEISARGEHNVGQLARRHFGREAYLVGFGTHAGTVAAASSWDEDVDIKTVRPSHERSYERVCHDSGVPAFLLPLRTRSSAVSDDEAANARRDRLTRALGMTHVGRAVGCPDVLRVALGNLAHEPVDLDRLAAAVLPGAAARLAHGQSDLVSRPTGVLVAGPIVVRGRRRRWRQDRLGHARDDLTVL